MVAPTAVYWTRFEPGTSVAARPARWSSSPPHLPRFTTPSHLGVVMQGDPDVLRLLNEQLTSELTAINQYFLHSKMQDNWGFTELATHTRAESFDEMVHAEHITDRILILDGLPNY